MSEFEILVLRLLGAILLAITKNKGYQALHRDVALAVDEDDKPLHHYLCSCRHDAKNTACPKHGRKR
jgi:hypothetical protein